MPKVTNRQAAINAMDLMQTLIQNGERRNAEQAVPTAQALIAKCRPQDREELNMTLAEVLATPDPASVELASYHEVEGVDDLVQEGISKVLTAVDEGLEAASKARTIAETLLEARLKMTNKHGLADITAESKYTKNIAHDMFVKAREGVDEVEDMDRWATHKSLARAVRNRISDVVVERLRSLDQDPSGFPQETLDRAQAEFPKLSWTEAIYALYAKHGIDLPRKGRTELAREAARARAALLAKAQAKELTAGAVTDVAAELEAVERLEASMVEQAHRAEKLPKADRAKVKARINSTIVTLAAEAAKL